MAGLLASAGVPADRSYGYQPGDLTYLRYLHPNPWVDSLGLPQNLSGIQAGAGAVGPNAAFVNTPPRIDAAKEVKKFIDALVKAQYRAPFSGIPYSGYGNDMTLPIGGQVPTPDVTVQATPPALPPYVPPGSMMPPFEMNPPTPPVTVNATPPPLTPPVTVRPTPPPLANRNIPSATVPSVAADAPVYPDIGALIQALGLGGASDAVSGTSAPRKNWLRWDEERPWPYFAP